MKNYVLKITSILFFKLHFLFQDKIGIPKFGIGMGQDVNFRDETGRENIDHNISRCGMGRDKRFSGWVGMGHKISSRLIH